MAWGCVGPVEASKEAQTGADTNKQTVTLGCVYVHWNENKGQTKDVTGIQSRDGILHRPETRLLVPAPADMRRQCPSPQPRSNPIRICIGLAGPWDVALKNWARRHEPWSLN
jgi:hypothetical protein